MNKTEAAQILNVDATDSAAQIEARYLQVTAFLSADADSIDSLKSLAESAKDEFKDAYQALPSSKKPKKQQMESVSGVEEKFPNSSSLMSLIFPLPLDSAGEPLSNQWWKVYQRAVILFFLAAALCFDQAPRLLQQVQKPPERYIPPSSTTPTKPPTDSPFGEVGPPPDSSTLSPGPSVIPPTAQNHPLTPDPNLNPTPNANPLIITPTQSPQSFLIGLFWAINQGSDVQAMVKDPTKPAVATMLMRSHVLTPRIEDVTDDKMKVISQLGGTATMRVNEQYFTGFQETNDYYLVSVNGVWKLSDIQPVTGGVH